MSTLRLSAVGLVCAALAAPAAAQMTYTWNPNTANTNWLEAPNWTGGAAGKVPGVSSAPLTTNGATTDIARFDQFFQGVSNGVALDFGLAGGQHSLGAINFVDDSLGGVMIGNSSATTAGTLRLNGATIDGVPNVVVADTGSSFGYYIFAANPQGGSGGPGMTIALGGAENVFMTYSSSLRVFVPITEAVTGAAVTVRGGAEVVFVGNSYTGRTRVIGSSLVINRDAALGVAPSSPTPGHLVLQSDAVTGPGVLVTGGATFELNANRGIAIGPTSGTGDGVLNVPDIEQPNFLSTVTYNGVIADNGGTGRLVKQGGGRLVLGGSNTYTGGTLHNGGELRLTNLNALGTTGTVTITPQGTTEAGFPLPGNLIVEAAGTFSRPVTVTYAGATVRPVTIGTPDLAAAGETAFSGAVVLDRAATVQGGNTVRTRFTGGISGPGAVTVTGTAAGRVVAFDSSTGSNFTYSGGTTVASGTLLLLGQTATQSGTGTGNVDVTGGTLGGNGRVAGAVTVGAGGRIIAGTDAANRTLTLADALTINGGKYRVVLFGAGDAASLLAVSGGATLANTPALELDLGGQTVAGLRAGGPRAYTILTAGSVTGTFVTPDFSTQGFESSEWAISYPGGTSVVLTFTPAPEPGAVLALAVAGLGVARLRRSRLRRGRPSRQTI